MHCTVWSGPPLSAYIIIGHIECIKGKQMIRWDFGHVWDESESVRFVHVRRRIFAWHGPYIPKYWERWFGVLHFFQHYLSHIKMKWWSWKVLCSESPYSHERNSGSSRIQAQDLMTKNRSTKYLSPICFYWKRICFVCAEVLQPSQPNRVMSSMVSLLNHTYTGQA